MPYLDAIPIDKVNIYLAEFFCWLLLFQTNRLTFNFVVLPFYYTIFHDEEITTCRRNRIFF